MSHTYSLTEYIQAEKPRIRKYLKSLIEDLKAQMELDPTPYTEPSDTQPSIAIRLCVDYLGDGRGGQWQVYTGDAAFDQVHYSLCGVDIIKLNTKVNQLLDNLIEQILQQENKP